MRKFKNFEFPLIEALMQKIVKLYFNLLGSAA